MSLPFHAIANIFPLIRGDDFSTFVDDVREHGLRKKVDLFEGAVLDGRNRYNALVFLAESGEILGPGWGHRAGEALDPEMLVPDADNLLFRQFNSAVDGDPVDYVASLNFCRRDLTPGQRGMAAADLARLGWGGDRSKPSREGLSAEQRAKISGASRATVERAQVVVDRAIPEVSEAARRAELPVSVAEKIARLPEADQPAALERALPRGNRAIMSSRVEPDDSLDYFPTPPWGTRALIERVLKPHGITLRGAICEPACGEGHIAEVLREYGLDVYPSDIFDHGYGEILDYLTTDLNFGADWIITNPPFDEKALQFVELALTQARIGVAMFFRSQWAVEGIERYQRLFSVKPPTITAFFAERVNLCKGGWDPKGSTATAYCWLVWHHGAQPRPTFWIPPGCREALSRHDDVERFTAHPVIKKIHELPREEASGTAREAPSTLCEREPVEPLVVAAGPDVGPQAAPPPRFEAALPDGAYPLDIPAFLKRTAAA